MTFLLHNCLALFVVQSLASSKLHLTCIKIAPKQLHCVTVDSCAHARNFRAQHIELIKIIDRGLSTREFDRRVSVGESRDKKPVKCSSVLRSCISLIE